MCAISPAKWFSAFPQPTLTQRYTISIHCHSPYQSTHKNSPYFLHCCRLWSCWEENLRPQQLPWLLVLICLSYLHLYASLPKKKKKFLVLHCLTCCACRHLRRRRQRPSSSHAARSPLLLPDLPRKCAYHCPIGRQIRATAASCNRSAEFHAASDWSIAHR